MGTFISSITNVFQQQKIKLALIGLDGAGKKSYLQKIGLYDKIYKTKNAFGFEIKKMKHKNLQIKSFDIGGNTFIG